MSTEPQTNEEAIYYEAVGKTADEREAYLQAACGDDAALLARIRTLLKAHEIGDSFLESAPWGPSVEPDRSVVTEGPGTVIGRYKLLEKIGEGGMAVVYMAEQEQPIRRKVALKIIKLGMDTRQVIARFEAERQALAMMDHPCIAKVLDAGATETGRPYFVMELVQGVSITEHCDRNSLGTKDRLRLFIQVCNAVQHAHQKGIIHRDLKPSNVMVTHHDGKPVPKVIDFGIAKATNQELTEKTLFTRYAHIIGTPAYMSPEQAELSDVDIDTRSDIYSLGVLLYELLTGTTPFSEEELRKVGYIEMQRVIREQEPVKPSTKISTLGETSTEIAKRRNSTPDLLRKAVRGDLDWIVMKSLEKDRTHRYETANAIAVDVQQHLASEPVLAHAPTVAYRMRKFLRRNRSQVLAALAIMVVAAAAVVVLSLWSRDRRQLDKAGSFADAGILSQARGQYARGDRQAAFRTVKSLLHSKHVGPDAQLLYAGILVEGRLPDEAMTILKQLLKDRPEIAGAAHSFLARILRESEPLDADKLRQIEEHRQRAKASLPDTAEAHFLQAMTAVTVKEQLALLDKAIRLEPDHYESYRLRAFTYYASQKYEKLRDDALAMAILRPRDPLGRSLRATAWREAGRYPEAIEDYDKALALTPVDSAERVVLATQRGETLLRMGDYRRVIEEANVCLSLWPDQCVFQYHQFCALTALGDYEKAETLFRQVIGHGQEARSQMKNWCAKYVFDTLESGRAWHPPDRQPAGAAFLPMVEAEETYRQLSTKARRSVTGGFTAQWSPEGKKLAFSLGVLGYSGVAIFDPATKETDLLIAPGKDPKWSPDGQYIAFVRDCLALRLEELPNVKYKRQRRPLTDQELWIIRWDGTEPRRLVPGAWPSWSADSTHIYYRSPRDNVLCSISVTDPNAESRQMMNSLNLQPSVSPDGRHVAYVASPFLTVVDLVSQTSVVEWPLPFDKNTGAGWSPAGDELCFGGRGTLENNAGLWIYRLSESEPVKVLCGQILSAYWSPDGAKLALYLGGPYGEIWTADLDPSVSAIETLGPARTLDEYFQEMVAFYTRRIETDPANADNYLLRAGQYHSLGQRANMDADMRQYRAILNGEYRSLSGPGTPSVDLFFGEPENLGPLVNGRQQDFAPCLSPDGLELYFTQGGEIWVTRRTTVDGKWNSPSKLSTPINSPSYDGGPSLSADGLSLYMISNRPDGFGTVDLWITTRATLKNDWGAPINLGATVNSDSEEWGPSISTDGLELYFASDRPGGYGAADLWVTRRATVNTNWGTPVNLGPTLNSSADDGWPSISADGLILCFTSGRPGSFSESSLYMTRRITTEAPWGRPMNLGPVINSASGEQSGRISPDGSMLVFASYRPGGSGGRDLWQSAITAVADPNGYAIGDARDLTILNGLFLGTDKTWPAGSSWSGLIDDVCLHEEVVSP